MVDCLLSVDSPELPEPPDPAAASAFDAEPSADAPSDEDEPPDDFERTPLVDDRSFFAQPEPLKCTVGVERAFFMVPSAPQAGQNRGPAS